MAWMVSASPSDLKTVFAELPRSGSWAIVDGQARHRLDYRAAFLYNFDTGDYSRLSAGRLWRAGFTPDSKSLLISRADTRQRDLDFHGQPQHPAPLLHRDLAGQRQGRRCGRI